MKITKFLKLILPMCLLCLLCGSAMAMEISRNNYVNWVLASAKGTSTSHFVEWENAINANCTRNRTRFSFEDKEIMSLLLSAKMSGKKVGFYYELAATTSSVPGHGSACQIVNVWFESD